MAVPKYIKSCRSAALDSALAALEWSLLLDSECGSAILISCVIEYRENLVYLAQQVADHTLKMHERITFFNLMRVGAVLAHL